MNNFSQHLDRAFSYFLHNELSLLSIFLFVSLTIFLFSWLLEPRRLINGILFTIFGLTFLAWFAVLIFSQKNPTLTYIFGSIAIAIMFGIIFLVLFSWVFFLWNAYFVWKYESHTLPNLLTLFIGLGMIFIWIIERIGLLSHMPEWLNLILSASIFIAIYLAIVMYNFLINLLLYQFVPRHYKQDYLIVLGAGLIQGRKVSRLLGARIDRAIAFSNKQYDKGKKRPKIIMSGGQGSDEKVSEAYAMKEYAIEHGMPSEFILLEDKSRNTQQNMAFSKRIAIEDFGSDKFKAKFFTNNYHLLRAGLYAKIAGLKANGVGATTRLYFLPNAIIREFAGVFVMHKKRHFIIIGLIAVFFIVQAVIILLGNAKWRMI
ncbi:YdcF family protein [uncultured Lactobacillus sp.]|uniref:YdcF family protein n=1 Tax=uncultured Lactobacillus sp. TaxID=153152 RepID=UPI002617B5C6|nr:YdcF family protein [uncultured Lactobacillus sp.]